VAVFDDTLERIQEPAITVTYDKSTACFAYRNKTTGQNLIVLWDNSEKPDDSFVTHPAQVEVKDLAISGPVWVDLVSGRIYEIPGRPHREGGRDHPVQRHPALRRAGADRREICAFAGAGRMKRRMGGISYAPGTYGDIAIVPLLDDQCDFLLQDLEQRPVFRSCQQWRPSGHSHEAVWQRPSLLHYCRPPG
jgi:hypothetical protein